MARTAQGIELDEDRAHQRVEWRIERVGWSIMVLLVVAALLGLLGDGLLGEARQGRSDGLAVEYQRLQRAAAPTEYRFSVGPALASAGRVKLRFDAALLEDAELLSVVPEPETVTTGPEYIEFAFAVQDAGEAPGRISFRFKPTTFGRVKGHVAADGATPLLLDQFIYP